jgi:hypothetical protein
MALEGRPYCELPPLTLLGKGIGYGEVDVAAMSGHGTGLRY